MENFYARLLEGFCDLDFGDGTKKAEDIFGAAEETEEMPGIDGSVSLAWHYWSKGFTLFFDRSRNDIFCCAEIDSSVRLDLWGMPLFSLNEGQLKKLLSEKGFRAIDEEAHEWGEKRITWDDAMADFYFEEGILVSINFGAPFDGQPVQLIRN